MIFFLSLACKRYLLKGIVHFEINVWYVLAYLKGNPRCRCLWFRCSFNFDIFRSNHCLSVI